MAMMKTLVVAAALLAVLAAGQTPAPTPAPTPEPTPAPNNNNNAMTTPAPTPAPTPEPGTPAPTPAPPTNTFPVGCTSAAGQQLFNDGAVLCVASNDQLCTALAFNEGDAQPTQTDSTCGSLWSWARAQTATQAELLACLEPYAEVMGNNCGSSATGVAASAAVVVAAVAALF